MPCTREVGRHTGTILSLLLLTATSSAPWASGPARIVKDINTTLSDSMGSFPGGYTRVGAITFFRAHTVESGAELWRTDGTEAGTSLVKDIYPGPPASLFASSSESFFAAVGDTLIFLARDVDHGYELWRSDGTEGGTRLLRDIAPAGLSPFTGFNPFTPKIAHAEVGGLLYFLANDFEHGYELWRSDGTQAGTFMLGDLRPGRLGAFFEGSPLTMAEAGGAIYFSADDGTHGPELWRTDGTTAGTALVHDIKPGPDGSNPSNLVACGGALLFSAAAAGNDVELWASDGTAGDTHLVKDLVSGADGSFPSKLTVAGGSVYFLTSAQFSTAPQVLWRTDGTAGVTLMLGLFSRGNLALYGDLDGALIFSARDDAHGQELWRSDGTGPGTVMIKDIRSGTGSSLFQPFLVEYGGALYFAADDGIHGSELWRSDGTGGGTVLVQDIAPGQSGSSSRSFVLFGRRILFVADDRASGSEPWVARAAILLGQPGRAVRDLADEVRSLHLPWGAETSLTAKLDAAAEALAQGSTPDAIDSLEEFINHVDVQTPKRIPGAAAAGLTEFAREILILLEGAPR